MITAVRNVLFLSLFYYLSGTEPPPDWPHLGEIQLENISVRYADTLPSVIRKVDLYVQPGEKVIYHFCYYFLPSFPIFHFGVPYVLWHIQYGNPNLVVFSCLFLEDTVETILASCYEYLLTSCYEYLVTLVLRLTNKRVAAL